MIRSGKILLLAFALIFSAGTVNAEPKYCFTQKHLRSIIKRAASRPTSGIDIIGYSDSGSPIAEVGGATRQAKAKAMRCCATSSDQFTRTACSGLSQLSCSQTGGGCAWVSDSATDLKGGSTSYPDGTCTANSSIAKATPAPVAY